MPRALAGTQAGQAIAKRIRLFAAADPAYLGNLLGQYRSLRPGIFHLLAAHSRKCLGNVRGVRVTTRIAEHVGKFWSKHIDPHHWALRRKYGHRRTSSGASPISKVFAH
jgi:hypothetical protein